MNDPAFRVVLETDSKASEAVLESWAVSFLRERGYDVAAPNETWETLSQFCERLGISPNNVRARFIDNPIAPKILTHRGLTGRILQILSNAAFDAFCLKNKK